METPPRILPIKLYNPATVLATVEFQESEIRDAGSSAALVARNRSDISGGESGERQLGIDQGSGDGFPVLPGSNHTRLESDSLIGPFTCLKPKDRAVQSSKLLLGARR